MTSMGQKHLWLTLHDDFLQNDASRLKQILLGDRPRNLILGGRLKAADATAEGGSLSLSEKLRILGTLNTDIAGTFQLSIDLIGCRPMLIKVIGKKSVNVSPNETLIFLGSENHTEVPGALKTDIFDVGTNAPEGSLVFIAQNIFGKVVKVNGHLFEAKITRGGEIRPPCGIAIHQANIHSTSKVERKLKEVDRIALTHAKENNVPGLIYSMVHDAEDIRFLRQEMSRVGYDGFVTAKLETIESIDNIRTILAELDPRKDFVMFGRGDFTAALGDEKTRLGEFQEKLKVAKLENSDHKFIIATGIMENLNMSQIAEQPQLIDAWSALTDFDGVLLQYKKDFSIKEITKLIAALHKRIVF